MGPAELAAIDAALLEAEAGAMGPRRDETEPIEGPKPRRGVLHALVNAQRPAPETLPLLQLPGPVAVATTAAEVDTAVESIFRAGVQVVGWDIEWPVSFVAGQKPKPVALMQFALPTAPPTCYLMHVARCGITPALRGLLEDARIVKVGVAAPQDAQKIMRDFSITAAGVFDVSELANRKLVPSMRWSLAALVARVLKCQLPKPSGVRIGAWDAPVLTQEQIKYAALDAFASLRLWQELHAMPALPEPAPALRVAAPLDKPTEVSRTCGVPIEVPAVQAPASLAATKQEAMRLHVAGLDVQQIAVARGIKAITVQNYLADAMCVL